MSVCKYNLFIHLAELNAGCTLKLCDFDHHKKFKKPKKCQIANQCFRCMWRNKQEKKLFHLVSISVTPMLGMQIMNVNELFSIFSIDSNTRRLNSIISKS